MRPRAGKSISKDAGVQRQAYAGLLWSKQYYHYIVKRLAGRRSASPPPPHERRTAQP